ncbi:MAG: hypothetical protein AAF696_06555 [Bacteroidota bacterium]
MSFHQLEDFVEDAIRLIHIASLEKSEKRSLIFNLYNFQSAHDCSYTHFRLADILQEHHYFYQWPIERHPDYKTQTEYFSGLKLENGKWIKGSFAGDDAQIYAREIAGKAYLYFDAGDHFWLRIKDQLAEEDQIAPRTYPSSLLFLKLLNIAAEEESELLARVYAVFVNSILEFYLDARDSIPDKFEDWLKDQELLAIRSFAEKYQDQILDSEEEDEFLALADLEEEMEIATKEEDKAKISFLLDFSTSLDSLKKKFQKSKKGKKDPAKFEQLYQYFRERLDEGWKNGISQIHREDHEYSFIKKFDSGEESFYASLILIGDIELNLIVCKIGIQMEKILSWQKREASPLPEHQHFIQDLTFFLKEEDLAENKLISNWGGWKYDLRHSEKTLMKRVVNMYEIFEKRSSKVFDFYGQSLYNWAAISTKDKVYQRRSKALDPGLNFFGSKKLRGKPRSIV